MTKTTKKPFLMKDQLAPINIFYGFISPKCV